MRALVADGLPYWRTSMLPTSMRYLHMSSPPSCIPLSRTNTFPLFYIDTRPVILPVNTDTILLRFSAHYIYITCHYRLAVSLILLQFGPKFQAITSRFTLSLFCFKVYAWLAHCIYLLSILFSHYAFITLTPQTYFLLSEKAAYHFSLPYIFHLSFSYFFHLHRIFRIYRYMLDFIGFDYWIIGIYYYMRPLSPLIVNCAIAAKYGHANIGYFLWSIIFKCKISKAFPLLYHWLGSRE